MDELDKLMYYGATPVTFEKANLLRNNMTPSEVILWEKIKGKQICNVRFRRQHPIDVYIVDFYCHAARLVIELDGKIHLLQKEYDRERTKEINYFDIEILRFTNQEILSDIEKVISSIKKTVKNRLKKSFKF